MERTESPLIVIVGPTASGKTSLAIDIALRHRGEIICADSRTVYRGLDIGTAKPTVSEMKGIPHWGIDLVAVDDKYTVVDFQSYAKSKIAEIRARDNLPIIVGGTGLYVDSIVFDYRFPEITKNQEYERYLDNLSIEELIDICRQKNIILPKNSKNKRHLISTILRIGKEGSRRYNVDKNTSIFGIRVDRDSLKKNIARRVNTMFKHGLVREAESFIAQIPEDRSALSGNVYPILFELIKGDISEDRAKQEIVKRDMQLAKRQMTWFKRNQYIRWGDSESIRLQVDILLNNKS